MPNTLKERLARIDRKVAHGINRLDHGPVMRKKKCPGYGNVSCGKLFTPGSMNRSGLCPSCYMMSHNPHKRAALSSDTLAYRHEIQREM